MKEYREGLEVMRTDELVDIIIEQDKRLALYKKKIQLHLRRKRNDHKQGKAK